MDEPITSDKAKEEVNQPRSTSQAGVNQGNTVGSSSWLDKKEAKKVESFQTSGPPLPQVPKESSAVSPTIHEPATVVVTSEKKSMSVWFYMLFLLTFFVFLSFSIFLFLTLTDADLKTLLSSINPSPTSIPAIQTVETEVIEPSPTLTPKIEKDEMLQELENISNSDKLTDLELELEKTDFSFIEEDLDDLDEIVEDINPSN